MICGHKFCRLGRVCPIFSCLLEAILNLGKLFLYPKMSTHPYLKAQEELSNGQLILKAQLQDITKIINVLVMMMHEPVNQVRA